MSFNAFASHPQAMPLRPALVCAVENTRVGDLLPHHHAPPHSNHKTVYFIRHGQSEANIAPEHERTHPRYRDAPLTLEGHSQARALQQVVDEWDVQVVYTSPLTRTLQTTSLAFENTTVPIIAWPVVMEFYPHMPECQGRNVDDLRKALELTSLKRFKDIRLDALVDTWWSISGDRHGRLSRFLQWLAICPETRIAVVAHWGFIHELLCEEVGCNTELVLHNCNYVRTVWACDSDALLLSPSRSYGIFLLPTGGATSEAGAQLVKELATFFKACLLSPLLRQTDGVKWGGLFHIKLTDFIALRDLSHVTELKQRVRTLVQEAKSARNSRHLDLTEEDVFLAFRSTHTQKFIKLVTSSPFLSQVCEKLASIEFATDTDFPEECFKDKVTRGVFEAALFEVNNGFYPASGPITRDNLREVLQQEKLPILESILLQDESNTHPSALFLEAFSALRWEIALVSFDEAGPRMLRIDASFPV